MFEPSSKLRSSREQTRSVHKVMQEINTELAKVHKSIAKKVDTESYVHATKFAEQYISYTSIWNMKFSYNMESPEVAVIQLMHIEYILNHEPAALFEKERTVFNEMQTLFDLYKPYTNDMIQQRKLKMQDYIDGKI